MRKDSHAISGKLEITILMEFTSIQLKGPTKKCMEEYLYGSLTKPYEPQHRSWN